MTEPHTALNLIQQTVAWAWLSGSIKRAQFDYRVGWSRDMLAALFAVLQGPDISSSSCFKIHRKWMASIFLNIFTCGREVQSPGTSLTSEIWHIYSYLCKANTKGTECPANPNWNIHIHPHPQMPSQRTAGVTAQIFERKYVPLKISGRKGGEVVFLRLRHKEQSYNSTESTDFIASGAFTERKWEMHILSCPPHDTIGIKLLVHCLHNKLSDPCSSPLSLNCEMTRVIPVKNESY